MKKMTFELPDNADYMRVELTYREGKKYQNCDWFADANDGTIINFVDCANGVVSERKEG